MLTHQMLSDLSSGQDAFNVSTTLCRIRGEDPIHVSSESWGSAVRLFSSAPKE
jgi:hypothetical protein